MDCFIGPTKLLNDYLLYSDKNGFSLVTVKNRIILLPLCIEFLQVPIRIISFRGQTLVLQLHRRVTVN